jgi:protein-L-isoaspartate(D-aspartate) O-methyltransferase
MDTLRRYGVRDPRILAAMERVPRHAFLGGADIAPEIAYGDHPLPIGHGQTISQPFIVAYMIERMSLRRGERVLEVGCGCGYLLAVLCELEVEPYGIERIPSLVDLAQGNLDRLGYRVRLRAGDGYAGWPEEAPFSAIIGSCAPAQVPQVLVDQLAPDGGRMILPVGAVDQRLVLVRREGGESLVSEDLAVRFVPMVRG